MSAPLGRRILIISPAWIGDAVLAQSLYKSLKRRDTQVTISVIAPAWSQTPLYRMPEVSDVIEMPVGHGELKLRTRWRMGRWLYRQGDNARYDQAIVLPRSFKSALLPWFAGIRQRTGYCGEYRYGLLNDIRPFDKVAMPSYVMRSVFLGEQPGTSPQNVETPEPSLTVDKSNRDACLRRLGLDTSLQEYPRVLALMPGAAFGPSKRWPPEYFGDVARRFIRKGWQAWVFGSVAEHSLGEKIQEHASSAVQNLCGRTLLEEAIDLLSLATLAVSNDTGLMHIAAAVGCPVVAIYGSTAPELCPPMIISSRSLWRNLECSPCRKRTCRYGHYRCLTEISPDAVYQAGCDLLS